MIILDTNVVSAVMRVQPDDVVLKWLDRQARDSVWTTSVSVLEIRFGLEILAKGRRRSDLQKAFDRVIGEFLGRRVAPFDAAAAEEAAILMGARQRRGEPRGVADSMIAGIALVRRATLATRNVKHFDDAGLSIVNPWED
jgi:toxin FitB